MFVVGQTENGKLPHFSLAQAFHAWEGGRFSSSCHARFTGVLLVGDAGGP
jgi:hypothetical protein